MGRTVDPTVAKTILQHLRGQDLHKAWVQNGSPGTWGNVQRRAQQAASAAPSQQQQPAPQPRLQTGGAPSSFSRSARARQPPASPTAPRPPRVASACRHPRLPLPPGGDRGWSFAGPAALGRYLERDYLHGMGSAQRGGMHTGDGRCSGADMSDD